MKKKAIDANAFEIDLIEEAGTVKAKPNPKLGESSEVPIPKKEVLKPCGRSRILRLTHAVREDDFSSEKDYMNVLEDLEEAGKIFGKLVNAVIPRPNRPGFGKAFVEYADLDSASRGRSGFCKCHVGYTLVVAEYYPENLYAHGDLDA